ncbi:MAG TPA: lipoyl(octanoyl) transferase LipB [Cyclobacteriaceae bacterium]|nr:lipoyl(octanoyl) transferase LipB [Cyclobacteriaceae bacterium]
MNAVIHRGTSVIDLGLVDYKEGWDYQTRLFNDILAIKAANRDLPAVSQRQTPNYLVLCEHPNVYTLGKSGNEKNLLMPLEQLTDINATYYPINRGGDITYHGPGQLVVYPVIDLENFFTDIHKYMRALEEAVIRTLNEFGIEGTRISGLTGVWLDPGNSPRKICAFGVKTSRWVTMHGLALNVNTDLDYFKNIVACGIDDKDKGVTSMEKELCRTVDMSSVKSIIKNKIVSLFEMKLEEPVA